MNENENLSLWNRVSKTDPKHTKAFKRPGGFSGTAIDPTYQVMKATEVFGPVGTGWGFDEVEHCIVEGIWFSRVVMWYERAAIGKGEGIGKTTQWGGTQLVTLRKDGTKASDDEAAKKSVTDGLSKCLVYLGFGADVHLGLYDDNKYVNDLKKEFGEKEKEKNTKPPQSSKPVSDGIAKFYAKAAKSEIDENAVTQWFTAVKNAHDEDQQEIAIKESFYIDGKWSKDAWNMWVQQMTGKA